MKIKIRLITFTSVLFMFTSTFAQENEVIFGIKSEKLTDNLYKLVCTSTFDVNVLASIGTDGILLIDAAHAATADTLAAYLKSLGKGDVKYIVNTHSHGDHTGGNRAFPEAAIIAHINVRERMSGSYYSLAEVPVPGIPELTIENKATLFFNDEAIEIIPLPISHTDGDMIVYFRASKIVMLGDMLFTDVYTFVDLNRGGDVQGYADCIAGFIEAYPDVTFIAGHGRDFNVDDLKGYHKFLTASIEKVQKAIDDGMNLEQIIEKNTLGEYDYKSWIFMDTPGWTTIVYNSLTKSGGPPVSICAPLTKVIVEEDVKSAIKLYHQLKKENADSYDFGENQLNMLGYQLIARGMLADAIEIFKLNTEEFPESSNVFDSLGEGYMLNGDKKLAIKNYKKSLDLNPENNNAVEMLRKLRE